MSPSRKSLLKLRTFAPAVALALPLAACYPAAAIRPKALPSVAIPKGCEANLSGNYVHASSASYRYRGADDGGTLVLNAWREGLDGGAAPSGEEGEARFVLTRTPAGFGGQGRFLARNGLQALCPVTVPAEVLACEPKGLLLRTTDASLNEACQQPPTGMPAWIELPLVRLDAGAPPLAPAQARGS